MKGTQRALHDRLDAMHAHAQERRSETAQRVAEAYDRREAERPTGPLPAIEAPTGDAQPPTTA